MTVLYEADPVRGSVWAQRLPISSQTPLSRLAAHPRSCGHSPSCSLAAGRHLAGTLPNLEVVFPVSMGVD